MKNETAKQVADVLDILIKHQEEKVERQAKKMSKEFQQGVLPSVERVSELECSMATLNAYYAVKGALSSVLT